MTQKTCSRCGETKKEEECIKGKKICRDCNKIACKEYKKKNKGKISAYNKTYKSGHKEETKQYNHDYNLAHRDEIQTRQTKYQAERKKKDPAFKLAGVLRKRLGQAIKSKGKYKKHKSTFKLLGCDLKFFIKWLKFLMSDDMTINNHGEVWHIDHVVACARFDIVKKEEQEKCFHWSNMQPLTVLDNLGKSDKLDLVEYAKHQVKVNEFVKRHKDNYDFTEIEINVFDYL